MGEPPSMAAHGRLERDGRHDPPMLRRMGRRDAYLEHLAGIPMFSACSKKDLKEIARRAEDVDVEAGRVLITEDKAGREFFVIVSGQAKVTRKGRKVADLGPGAWFGELALLDGGKRNATVTAASPMEVVVLERGAFTDLLEEVPTIAFKLATGLARRLREADRSSLH